MTTGFCIKAVKSILIDLALANAGEERINAYPKREFHWLMGLIGSAIIRLPTPYILITTLK
jgi:hypothetical protein